MTIYLLLGFGCAAFYLFRHFRLRSTSHLPLPPGPRPLPIVGNVLSLPSPGVPEYQHWLKFKNTYGPISSITVFGQTIVILHGEEEIEELLEKQSTVTSGRPSSIFVNLSGFDKLLPSMQYTASWRQHRKIMHQYLGTEKLARRFNNIQDVESRRLLLRTLVAPAKLIQHFKTEVSAIMLHMTYGYAIEPHTFDPLLCLIEKMMENFSDALVPMSWLVDIITPLRFLPSYLPGMSFKATARQWYSTNEEVMRVPFDFVQQQMARGTHRPSFVSSILQDHTEANENGTLDDATKHTIMSVAGIMYGAGADTTAAVLSAFVLAMILFPEVQDRAQEEIDSTIGGRLPDFEDRENLPYVSAVTMESLRWFPITPINTTHVANTEIQYKGYRIPKGAYLLASNWWLLHNPETYDNPASFDPDRFLVRNEPDPASVVFGYGRRICPGRYVADKSLFITIARLLSAFTISKAASDPSLKFTSGLIAHPEEFEFHIRPRSERHAELVQAIEKDIPWEHGDSRLIDV